MIRVVTAELEGQLLNCYGIRKSEPTVTEVCIRAINKSNAKDNEVQATKCYFPNNTKKRSSLINGRKCPKRFMPPDASRFRGFYVVFLSSGAFAGCFIERMLYPDICLDTTLSSFQCHKSSNLDRTDLDLKYI